MVPWILSPLLMVARAAQNVSTGLGYGRILFPSGLPFLVCALCPFGRCCLLSEWARILRCLNKAGRLVLEQGWEDTGLATIHSAGVCVACVCLNYQLSITRWPCQSRAPVGAAPPTRSQLRLQRHTQVPVQAQTIGCHQPTLNPLLANVCQASQFRLAMRG